MRAIVQSSKGKFNCWFVMEEGLLDRDEARKGLFFLLGGDSCADTRSQVGRCPASFNPKYLPPTRAHLLISLPRGLLRGEVLIRKVIEKSLVERDLKDMYRFVLGLQVKREMIESKTESVSCSTGFEEEDLNSELKDKQEMSLVTEKFKISYEKTNDGIDYCLAHEGSYFRFYLSFLPFKLGDGRIDRSRFDWALLKIISQLSCVNKLERAVKCATIRGLFMRLSLKYKETSRVDYAERTVRNFLKNLKMVS